MEIKNVMTDNAVNYDNKHKKRVWLVAHYAMPPQYEVRVKTIRYARILQERGYDVLLITASTLHNTDINLIKSNEKYIEREYEGLKYVHIKCSDYRGNGIKRIKNMRQFDSRFSKVMRNFELPDVIIDECVCVNYRGVMKFAKKREIPFVAEIRDLWPLSIVEYLGFSDKNPIIRYLYREEKRFYTNSDAVIFSMEGGYAYICEKGWDKKIPSEKVFFINNGVDLKEQEEHRDKYRTDDPDLYSDLFKVIYAGSVRTSNSIELLIDAAVLLKDNKDIVFLIYGDGDKRAELEKKCNDIGLQNIKFKGKTDKKNIPFICSRAGLNFVSVRQSRISQYGVSWNKLFDYMAAGKPILSNVKVNYDLLKRYNCGISLETQDAESIAEGILKISELPREQYDRMCENAKNAALDFDYEKLTDKLEEVINYAVNKKENQG